MNRVVTVNLNGNAYQLEESGYEALSEYLADAEAKLKADPGLSEIMADLEQAIADKCYKHLSPNKNVVTKAEIEQILLEMGRVEADAEPGEQTGRSEQPGAARSRAGAAKRLYRIHAGSMIGGVCNGLAAYLNIDVTLIRLAWGVLAIASWGFFILVYLMAMFVIPEADTLEECAEAHGQPFNAQGLVEEAKKHSSNFQKSAEDWWKKTGSPDWRYFKRNFRRESGRAAWQARRAMRRASFSFNPSPDVDHASHILAVVMLPFFGLVVAALTVVWIFAVISLVNTGAVFGWPLPLAVPLWVAILALLALYGAVVGPFRVALEGRGYFRGGRYYGWPGVVGGLVWLVCLALAFAFAYAYIPEVHALVDNVSAQVVNRLGR
jgi:phage shock protein PspC (stress-responsive transcriptional regulator)